MIEDKCVRCSTCRGRTTVFPMTVLTSLTLWVTCVSLGLGSSRRRSCIAGPQWTQLYYSLASAGFPSLAVLHFFVNLAFWQFHLIDLTNAAFHRAFSRLIIVRTRLVWACVTLTNRLTFVKAWWAVIIFIEEVYHSFSPLWAD